MLLITLAASMLGSVFALIGGVLLLWKEQAARRHSLTLVSFAAGSLMGAAFLELIPEAAESIEVGQAGIAVIAGIFAIFLFEKVLRWYHCHGHEICDFHAYHAHVFSKSVILGDSVHNFIDGIAIALSFSISFSTGVATTLAVFFHEVPQEIADFGVLLHAGYARKKVFLYNLASALAAPVGALVGYVLLPVLSGVVPWFIAFAAGSFIYISASDLLPELKSHGRGADLVHIGAIIAGIAIIMIVGMFAHA